MEDITNVDYMHVKIVSKDFKSKKFYVNFMICFLNVIHYIWLMFSKTSENCDYYYYYFFQILSMALALALAWQAALKKLKQN